MRLAFRAPTFWDLRFQAADLPALAGSLLVDTSKISSNNGAENSKENASYSRAVDAIWVRLRFPADHRSGGQQQGLRYAGERGQDDRPDQ